MKKNLIIIVLAVYAVLASVFAYHNMLKADHYVQDYAEVQIELDSVKEIAREQQELAEKQREMAERVAQDALHQAQLASQAEENSK